jgi:hypothetical protein
MGPPVRLLVPAVAAVLLLAACGSDDETSTSSSGTETELTFALDTDGSGGEPPQEAQLTCPGGDADACAAVDALPADPGAPTPANQACTEVYGGPDTLTVNGTLNGEPIAAAFDRTNGCEIQRFDQFADVLAAIYDGYRGGTSVNVN